MQIHTNFESVTHSNDDENRLVRTMPPAFGNIAQRIKQLQRVLANRVTSMVKAFIRNKLGNVLIADISGNTALEYALTGSGIAVAIAVVITLLGGELSTEYNTITSEVSQASIKIGELQTTILSEANVWDAENLTQDQLDTACGNESTVLSNWLSVGSCE